MVEIKESKEQKSPDVSRLVDESMARLHDMERRLHAVQGHLSGLVNMANILYQSQPTNQPQTPLQPPLGPEFGSLPQAAYASAFPSPSFLNASGIGGPAAFGNVNAGGPATFGARASTPWLPSFSSSPVPTMGGQGLSARDFEKLPAVARVPEVNFIDAGERYIVKVELPGVRKDDLDITVTERMVTIDADARREIGEGTVLLGEVLPTVYRRTIALPSACNSAKSKANLKDGFLTIEVPKKEPTEGPRKLDVAYG